MNTESEGGVVRRLLHASRLTLHDRNGQMIVEAMVAASILVVGFLGMLDLVSRSFYLDRVVTNGYTGSYLASEGVEIVKNMLDHNYEASITPWNTGFANGNYEVDYSSLVLGPLTGNPLKYDPSTGLYGYGTGNATKFVRTVNITLQGADEVIVKSTVTWSTNSLQSNAVVEDHFYNWRPAPGAPPPPPPPPGPPPPPPPPFAVVQTSFFGSGAANAPAIANSSPISVTAGNLLALGFRNGSGQTVLSVTDTAGNTFVSTPSVTNGVAEAQIWYAKNIIANPADVITVTLSGLANSEAGYIWEIAGASTVSPLDVTAGGTNAGTSPVTSNSFSTTAASELVVALATANTQGLTFAAGPGYTLDNGFFPNVPAGGTFVGAEHIIYGSAQAGVTSVMTFAGPAPAFAGIAVAAFK